SGVNFVDNGNGTATLSGTPAAGTDGVYALTFTATHGAGSAVHNFTTTVAGVSAGQVLISEFRLRGPAGIRDEYINLYNNTDTDIAVSTTDASTGWALVGADGVIRFTIPNGTLLPARGSYLAVNNGVSGFSLGAYPAGTGGGTVGTGDAPYSLDIPSSGVSAGIALFRS